MKPASTRGDFERARFLEAVLHSAIDYAIIALDLDGHIIEWTEGAQRILGWTSDEMLGRHLSVFFTPDDVAAGLPDAEMRGARESGRASDELWHLHRDGTRFFALGEMMPLSDQTGELVGYLKILRDRTQQRLAEDALRDREAFLSSVLASSGDCIQVLDLDGRLSFMTEAGQKVMEVGDFGVLCGISWPTLWTETARGEAQKAVATARAGSAGRFQGFCPTLKGTPKHWDVVVTPIRSAEGTIVNLLAISRDITAMKAAEAARDAAETKLRFDENLLAAILRGAPVGIAVSDARSGEAILLNDTLKAMLGPLSQDRSIERYEVYGAVHPDGRRYAKTDYPSFRVLNTGKAVPWEDMRYRREGEVELQLFEVTSAPVHDATDEIMTIVTILRDVGVERTAKAEAAKLAELVEQSSDLISIATLDGRFDYLNPAGLTLLGLPSIDAARGINLLGLFSPESRETFVRDALPMIRRGDHWEGELVLRLPGRNDLPVSHNVFPVRDAGGAITCFGAVTRDRSAQQAEEARRHLLSHELSHRMKNMLAMVQSIGFQTLRSAPDLATARETLSARIVAMSKAHDLLLEDSGHSAELRTVIGAAVAPHDDIGSRARFTLTGPNLAIGSRAAMALSLMLHELATNAVKYGALSVPTGGVAVEWSITAASFTLLWRERGGPPVVPPTRAGFGTRLIERGLAADVGGKVTLEYAPDGLICEMTAALLGLQSGI